MSWFDTSSFSSFAKTALTQAQNLQKSIDRVLDIEDDASSASNSSAPSKDKLSSSSGSSVKESLTTKKSSSLLSATSTSTSKSTRKASSDENNAKGNDSEGNSFWSSFLGDSAPVKSESKTSSRRSAAGRKLGSRVSRATRRSVDGNETATPSDNSSNEKENLSSSRTFKQDGKSEDSVINTFKSNTHLSASKSNKKADETESVSNALHEKSEKKTKVPVVEDGREENVKHHVQESTVKTVESGNAIESKDLIVSDEKSFDSNSDKLVKDSLGDDNTVLLNNSANTSSRGLKERNLKTACEEPVFSGGRQSEGQNLVTKSTVDTAEKLLSEELHRTEMKAKGVEHSVVTIKSQDAEEVESPSMINSMNSGSTVDHDDTCTDSTDNIVGADTAIQEVPSEIAEKEKFVEVEPLASSTPNHFLKGLSVMSGKEVNPTDEELPLKFGEFSENLSVIKENDSELPLSGLQENELVSEDVKNEQSDDRFQSEEVPCEGMKNTAEDRLLLQQSSENVVIKENKEETKNKAVKIDHENSTESSEDLKQKIEHLQNELDNLTHVVEVRESKLVQLSKENVDLQETATILRSQLKQAEDALKTEDEEIEEVRKEFTVRVAATEKKFHAAAKERDQLKALLEQTEKSLSSRNDRQAEEFTTLLKEKDDQIAQLLEEGEKLSKQELQINNTIKKLRAKEKENEVLIKKNSKDLEDMTAENTRLTEILKVKDETERKQADAIAKLNAYVEKQDEQVSKLKSELDDSAEKIRSMQTALDNAYKQLADLHKENASKDSAVQEAALSAEINAKEGLRIAMEKKERQFKKEIETLEFQISDLQTSLRRGEQQTNRREDNLRQEISDMQQRLQEAESRNQELTESVTHATRPLLRQIENLQNSYGNHTQTWERVERNLTDRLNEAQIQLAEAQEKERVATEHALELNSRLTAVESQLSTYRQDKSRLEAALEVERARLDTAEEAKSRQAARVETLEVKYRKMMEDNNVEKALLEQQLAVERSKLETEKKRFQNALDEQERILLRQTSFSGVPPSPSASNELSQEERLEGSPLRMYARQSSSSSIVDGISRGIMGAGPAMVERLQAQVKQKDGEIELLQDEINSLQKTRDSLTEELTSVSSKLENVEQDSWRLADLRTRYNELDQRHNAVLQMYGEKAEECEELKMDLEDVKSMYKTQIQELLGASR